MNSILHPQSSKSLSPCVLVHAHELVKGYKEHLPRFLVVFTVEPEGNKRSNDSKQHTVHIVNWVAVNHIKISECMKNRSFFYSEHSLLKGLIIDMQLLYT